MKENFDDILKRKWEAKQFPVDANHRADMAELLNTKKRRGIFPFWWLGGLMVVTAVAGYFFLTHKGEVKADLPKQELKIKNEKLTQTNELASDVTLPNDVLNQSKTTDTQSSAELKSTAGKSSSSIRSSSESSISGNNSSPTINTESTNEELLSNKTHTSNTTVRLQIKTAGEDNSNDQSVIISDIAIKKSDPATNAYFPVEDEAMRSVIIATEPVGVTIPDTKSALESEVDPSNLAERRALSVLPFLDPLFIEGIQYTADDAPGVIKAQTSFKKSLYLFGETGVGMIFASEPDYTSGWKFRAGGGLGYKLSPKVQLSWSLGYLMQDGGFDFERTSTVNQSGFGVRSSFNTLTPERLHFVYTRFGMQYRMHRHLLGIHGGIQYLYGAQGTIVIQKQDQFAPYVTETSAKTWVNTNGLRKLNWTADISYGYQLTPRLSAVAGTDIYFSSITIPDAALAQEGYIWNGSIAALHPFITLNYLIYGR